MSRCHKCTSDFTELHDPESLEGLAKQHAVVCWMSFYFFWVWLRIFKWRERIRELLLFIFPFSRSSVCPAYLMMTTVVFLSACRNHHTFLFLSNVVFYWAHSSTLTMGGADCAEGHPDTGAEWLTFIVGLPGFQLWLWTAWLCMYTWGCTWARTPRKRV